MKHTMLILLAIGTTAAATPAAAQERSLLPSLDAPFVAPPQAPADRLALQERLLSLEGWQSAGKTLTYAGISVGALGGAPVTVGLMGYWSGAFSLNIGSMAGGAIAFNVGLVAVGVGVAALAVGIPMWAVSSSRLRKVKLALAAMPSVSYDAATRTTRLAWGIAF